ncbi:hypothetical protein H7I77_09690 [Mycolicibacterium novocastrense]|uniref:N-acetyltransferase domain-containing protein n=1 Tax=Mycolicibacterium novocastrense TaxID=59813 RepID=A0AAW5SHT9_MYCNV|nr:MULTISPECIES: hypothetical protein [Mycolicibacterium]MCV7023618.1 hypothetical protein [Mycolicibacterium novocastrense]MDX1886818.1 hypothetical protein [Mycolicibacterium sp. 120270]GAT07740.1 uncharacterized protein RMCN_0873 [Mycolicibacterium novocastrense]
MDSISLADFTRDLDAYTPATNEGDTLEFVAPRLHYASQDSNRQLSCCLDWRADVQLAVAEAHATAPDISVGYVDFLILQLGQQPAAQVLDEYPGAARFGQLFDGEWLAPDIDEQGPFAAAGSIDVVLIVVDVCIDSAARGHNIGAWAVSEVIATMLPTSAGMAVMSPDVSRSTAETVERVNRYWRLAGLQPIDGHPGFLGQATAFTHLDAARRALADVRDTTFRVPVAELRARVERNDVRR